MLSPLLNILKLPRRTKRGIYLLLDTALVPLCLLAAHALRYGMLVPTKALEGWHAPIRWSGLIVSAS